MFSSIHAPSSDKVICLPKLFPLHIPEGSENLQTNVAGLFTNIPSVKESSLIPANSMSGPCISSVIGSTAVLTINLSVYPLASLPDSS